MKNEKSLMTNTARKVRTSNPIFGFSKFALFFLLFSAIGMKGQSTSEPPIVLPYPAMEIGQKMIIDPTSSVWSTVMEQSNKSRAQAQAYISANAGSTDPSWVAVACVGDICCTTEAIWFAGVVTYYTDCMNVVTLVRYDTIMTH